MIITVSDWKKAFFIRFLAYDVSWSQCQQVWWSGAAGRGREVLFLFLLFFWQQRSCFWDCWSIHCFLRCPLMRHMSKKIMKGWPIQRVFMHSADILAFCGSPDFIFAWPDFWDPGRHWGLLGSLSCGIYCTFFTRTGSCFRKHSVITERISRQLPFWSRTETVQLPV